MRISFKLTWRHLAGGLVVTLVLMNIGRLYQHQDENHSLVYVGARRVWRYSLQSVKDVHRQWVQNYPWCRGEGGSVSECLTKTTRWSVNAVIGERPAKITRQFFGIERPEIIPAKGNPNACLLAASDPTSPLGKLSDQPMRVKLAACGMFE
jgi:hypothetical protein